MITITGKSVFGGVSIGKLSFYKRNQKVIKREHVEDVEAECARFQEAKAEGIHQLKELYDKSIADVGEANAMIFEIHQMMLEDLDYIESIEKATPSGMFFERDVLGMWVAAEGIVYRDFNPKIHLIDRIPENERVIKYIGGIDFGFEHYGSIVVLAKCSSGKYYLVEEIAEQHKYIDWWKEKALELQNKYYGITFYCDTARTEHISKLRQSPSINARYAEKAVIEGIERVGSLLKQGSLFFLKDKFKKGLQEMYLYTWNDKLGKEDIKKENDDVLDALRYAIFSEYKLGGAGMRLKPRGM